MITDSFDNKTQPILTLKDFYGERKHLVDICLITFSKNIFNYILSTFRCEEIAEIEAPNGNTTIYKFTYQGKDIAFYLSCVGSTAASQFSIEANWLTGASKFIMFGSAGSLDDEKTTNKYVIPTEAYRDEGMSYHYAPPNDYIKVKNSDKIKNLFDMWNIPNVQGRVWTTDAILRETAGQVALRKSEGCIAVDMEVAGVQAVCDFCNFELYNFLVTGDVLCENSYDNSKLPDANHNLDKLQIALNLAINI
ncbi:MAG: nucleoside phosphorylase [Clostridia bacterium]|nr:nucleoside phosphorylase [Clostridia bacterium]